MPKISVVIPTYNCARYLPEAIDGVLAQSYQDFEIVIVDDGSTDNTESKVGNYIKKYSSKIRYSYQKNKGLGSARNTGIREAKGEYIAFSDSDDYYLPEFLDKCLFYLVKHKWDFVTSKCLYHRKVLDTSDKYELVKVVRDALPENPKELYRILFQKHVSAQTMLVRKACFENVSFCTDYAYAEDWDMWLKLVEAGFQPGLVSDDKPLWVYRIRKDSMWNNPSRENEKKRWMSDYIVLKRHKKEAFARDSSLRKIYAEKLLEISKNIFYIRSNNLLGIKILLESQIYYFDWKVILNLFIHMAKKVRRSIEIV